MEQKTPHLPPFGRQVFIDLLHTEKCSCVISHGNDTRIFRERGVKDLYRLFKEEPEFLRDAFIADKVIGKGAAALLVLGGIGEVYSDVISDAACQLLEEAGIPTHTACRVPHIINRTQTDRCPLEKRCDGLQTAADCLPAIEEFIARMKS